jgi:uncharacterized membrane protein YhaH (DUF805 family)
MKRGLTSFLFSSSQRADRKDYWLAWLFWITTVALIVGIMMLVDFLMPFQSYYTIDLAHSELIEWLGAPRWIREPEKWVLDLWTIAGLISMAMVSIRRAHDRGRSGWWLLLMYVLIPWAIIELGFLPGTKEETSYGPAKIVKEWN